MLITAIEKQKQEIYKKGLVDGIADGMFEGMEKKKIEIAEKMLFQGLEISFIVQITGLSEAEVIKLKIEKEKTH